MSMEQELARIADALESIEKKLGTPLVVEEHKPAQKRASTKKIKELPVEEVVASKDNVSNITTAKELMDYCNNQLVSIADKELRTATIKKVVAMFKEKYDVATVKEIAEGKVAQAKADFDALLGGEVDG